MNYSLSKSAKLALSKSILYVKNQSNFFKKYKLSMNINLGDFFSKFNFLTTLLSKIMPNFPHRNLKKKSLVVCRFLAKNLTF